ncbi:hypothetical protein D0Y65_010451 [Glycine soja]|uniref:Uncharacterized protein n=1 Tax=Glycine soja TaxID=3848 RepID=A0A445L3S9_GLYSO|nr:hypothetical protein D0Y65_010451 [Glycine soja]
MEKSESFSSYCSSSYHDFRAGLEDQFTSYSFNSGPRSSKRDVLATNGNPELKRRKRVASYNMYTMEAKLKTSFRSFKWIKNKLCRRLIPL